MSDSAFTVANVFFTALGATILWGRWGRDRLRPYLLPECLNLLDRWFSEHKNWKDFIEFAIFIFLGTVVAIMVVEPSTSRQAFAAGLGWTGLVARPG